MAIAELESPAVEKFDPIVVKGIVGCRHDDTGIGCQMGGEIGHTRCRQNAGQICIRPQWNTTRKPGRIRSCHPKDGYPFR